MIAPQASPPPADLALDRDLARRMERAWFAFFAPFGRLTPVQRAAIPPLLAGDDLLVCAATASGKTEAACAPLVERHLGRADPWMILYVSPTRALINDLHARLSGPLAQLGLRVGRRTGEYRADLDHPPQVLLTTPESFDSLLCRGRRRRPDGHALAGVAALVLDEVHLLHGTSRGEQVRWLIERLRRLRREARAKGWAATDRLQIVGLSATVTDPEGVVAAYLPGGRTVAVAGGRAIETVAAPVASARVEVALPAYLAARTASEKVLVFANERRRVDELTAKMRRDLRPLGYAVRAHHGSLDRREREATEAAVRAERRIVVFATSTLEIGVDIGDIDLIVLDEPPPDIPALLQRIGRGNRRSGATRVMACARALPDSLVHAAMIEAARDGWLGPAERGPQHAVARQQAASYIYQGRRIARARGKVQDLLDRCAALPVARGLLDTMVAAGELREDAAGLRLGDSWLDRLGRGELHSTIEEPPGAIVEDEETGAKIASGVVIHDGRGLRAGGQLLQIRRWNDYKIEVRRVSDEALAQGEWQYSSRPWMRGAGQPQAVRRYLGLAGDEWPVVLAPDGASVYVFHFGGARRRAVLDLLAGQRRADDPGFFAIDDWLLQLPAGVTAKPPWLTSAFPAVLEVALATSLETLETTLGRPAANAFLPIDARLDEARGWLCLDEELAQLRQARWTTPRDPDVTATLRVFGAALAASEREEPSPPPPIRAATSFPNTGEE